MKHEFIKMLKLHKFTEIKDVENFNFNIFNSFCIYKKEVLINLGKVGFVVDFSKSDLSCYGMDGETTYTNRDRCVAFIRLYIDCQVKETDIFN